MDGRRTGVEEYTLGVLQAMLAVAPADTFLLFANSRRPMRLPTFSGENVRLATFAYPNTLFNLSLKFARRPALDRLLGDVGVFFLPSFRLAPLSPRCPLVVTVHDLSFVRHPEFFSPKRRLWHRFMEPRALARRAAAVIAVSDATAADVASLCGVPRSRIAVIPSGIAPRMRPLEPDDPARARVRERYRLPERFVLFLGTLEPRKNLGALLDAYAGLRESGAPHALVLAGMRGWVREEFFARVARHPYARDIRLTGFVDDADKPAVYGLADLFVYPSFYEGFGFPPVEALACGTPVVTSYNSAIPEVAGSWAALVNPYDVEELAEVMLDRLRSPPAVPPDVSTAIRERYSWDRAGRETLGVLRRAVQGAA